MCGGDSRPRLYPDLNYPPVRRGICREDLGASDADDLDLRMLTDCSSTQGRQQKHKRHDVWIVRNGPGGQKTMLTNVTFLKGLVIHATDGELGHVDQLYFDDETWAIRYLTVDTGG